MPVERLAIVVAYGRTERTMAALRLAELAQGWGVKVRLISVDPITQRVHPQWDGAIRRARDPRILKALLSGCDQEVWFVSRPEWRGRLPVPRYGLALCLRWDQLTWTYLGDWGPDGPPPRHPVVCFWDAGAAVGPPAGLRSGLFVHLDRHAAADLSVLFSLRSLRERHPQLRLTVWWEGFAPLVLRRALRGLSCQELTDSDLETWACGLSRHSVAWFPAPSPPFGVAAVRALACGARVVAPRLPVYASLLEAPEDGQLVPPGGSDVAALEGMLAEAVPTTRSTLAARRGAFAATWRNVWGLG